MKRNFLYAIALLAGMSAQAVTSPYAGSEAGEGTFYLYQVETGQWLQSNRSDFNQWTTFATLNDVGFDVQLKKLEGFEGYQIFCNFTNNGSLNGADQDRFFLDQPDRDITDWIFVPVTVDGVTNAYKIMAKATPEGTGESSAIANDIYIGANDGQLSDNPTDFTWQLVSREERLEKMVADAANGPVDATWLIPYNDLGRNDMRDRLWTRTVVNNFGGAYGIGGSNGYPVQEYWHNITMRHSITLTGLPKGTYAFSVQAYYRDTEIESSELAQRYLDGNENLRVSYFAGASSNKVMSIFADAKSEQTDGYSYNVERVGKWVPNSMGDAARAMFDGAYINEYIQAPVNEDGTLTIGIEKPEADYHDWLIHKRFFLQYVSTDAIAEDLTALKNELKELIATAEQLPSTPTFSAAIATAKEQLENAKSSSALLEAIASLQAAVDVIKSAKDTIAYFHETKAITDALGINTTEAVEKFNTATTRDDYNTALTILRYTRRIYAADTQADVFPGQPVALGKFYLYNVGRKQFLCGGSDWGAHAALGIPGVEVTLEDGGESGAGLKKYLIETGLYNGENSHYLNYRGYMDCAPIDGFAFIPVEGKENVYNIVQGDYPDVHMAWNPYAGTDQGNNDETTVGTECRNLDPTDLNAQWKLVTREERNKLLESASLDNPADATFFMHSPNFSQRENADTYWSLSNFNIWEYGANHYDFNCESYNQDNADLCNMVEGLPAGIYAVSAQAYFRAGELSYQANNEPEQLPIFYAGNDTSDDVLIPNILSESGKCPGEGGKITSENGENTYEVPNSCVQASNFFKSGLYKVYTVIDKPDDNDLAVGIMKESKIADGDWVMCDNFRIRYYGKNTTKEDVKEKLSGVEEIIEVPQNRTYDNRIFNLQGIEVTNPTVPGIYIQNGKKFIVK